jgi:hypothetical protein
VRARGSRGGERRDTPQCCPHSPARDWAPFPRARGVIFTDLSMQPCGMGSHPPHTSEVRKLR